VLDDVRRWFEACGYVVSERVGEADDRVERFATPRQGLMPPRIWWTLVPRFPDDLEAATAELDRRRAELGADRALAIVTHDVTPAGHRPDLDGALTSYVSARHLALHLAGVFDAASAMARTPAAIAYFPHRIQGYPGETADACERLEAWIEEETETPLAFRGVAFTALAEIVREAARRRARRFLDDPDQVVPITLAGGGSIPMLGEVVERGWAVHAIVPTLGGQEATIYRVVVPGAPLPPTSPRVEELAEPTPDEVIAWFRSEAPHVPIELLRAWFLRDVAARRLFQSPDGRAAILAAAREETRSHDDDLWLPSVVARAFDKVMNRPPGRPRVSLAETSLSLEDAALQDFALGQAKLRQRQAGILFEIGLLATDEAASIAMDGRRYKFASTCVRDWFLARKIARDVRSGNSDILARHLFPREEVGLFLDVIAPDVAVLVGAGRAEEMRRLVESEVARRVELTLGHQLNRSIGSLSAHVRTVRRAIRESEMDERTRSALLRIDEELDHLRKLTERSRLLNEARQWEIASLPLLEIVTAVTDPLREKHPAVGVDIAIAKGLTVRAARDGLREVVHCLLENAFHSVCTLPEEKPRNLEIAARREGETVRMVLKDNGIGVRPEDRERIFEPFVTTKTGGSGRPRGTGLGLSIARTFAESMGARVTLESSNGETIFVLILVAGD